MVLSLLCSARAEGSEVEHEVKQREEKLKEIEEKQEEQEKTSGEITIIEQLFGEKVRLNGFIESNYEYVDVEDTEDDDSGSRTDLFVSSVALAVRVYPNKWSKAKIQLELEDMGKKDETTKARLDEATVTVKAPWVPLYLTGGKTVMPFGVFEDHLIEGTLAEDLYEIDEVGATVGFAPDFYGLDISLSVYDDASIMENLNDFDTHEFREGRQEEGSYESYIANITLEPVEDILSISTFYNSEPGDGRRNNSIGGALTLNFWKFVLDAEYIAALQREDGENEQENKESAAVVGLAFDVLDSMQLAGRYEAFDDDNPGDQDEVLDYRLVSGFNYSLIDLIDIRYIEDIIFSCEYRFSRFEKEKGSDAADSQKMLQFQLAVEF
ncbi:MAG: porin [Deltaproteobacteria bacterium]|jgi:hypothetical protein|nr:porin [Deltaproteobacteria bacterium]